MSSRVRVLIVDDSAAVRRLLHGLLAEDDDIEVVAAVGSAAAAMAKLRQGGVDLVTLDVEMPDVTGLELLEEVRKLAPQLPVIMFSSLTQRAASTTLDALARGASDYVTKPAGAGDHTVAAQQVRDQLLPKIKSLGRKTVLPSMPGVTLPPTPRPPVLAARPELVVVGASTGGPNALSAVFKSLSASFPVPVLVVQHMPPLFTQLLADRLDKESALRVREARDGDLLQPGVALLAPGNFHLRAVREDGVLKARLDQTAPENSCRPAVDVLFRSAAEACGGRVLGAVLTGMGQDGLLGAQLLKRRGAQLIVQDEASSIVWGMPGFIARAGLADAVLGLEEVAKEMVRRVGAPGLARPRLEGVAHAGH